MNNSKALNAIYYPLKPVLPRRIQIWLRSKVVLRKRKACLNLWPILEKAAKQPEGWSGWPEEKRFALVLAHDVDTACGHEKCLQLAEIEKRLGFRSSFNFVPERYTVSPDIRNHLTANGFEVGVHGLKHDGKLFASERIFQHRSVHINHYLAEWGCSGFTSPSMHHRLDWMHHLKISHATSTFDTDPFEPQPDGAQTIFPIWVQGPNSRGYVELPYTLPQDFTLFVLMKAKNNDIWKLKLDWIVEKGGMALLNVHPDYMNFDRTRSNLDEYPVRYYEQFLEYLKSKYEDQYWNPLAREISLFWKCEHKETTLSNLSPYEKEHRKINSLMLTESNFPLDPRVKQEAFKLVENGHRVSVIAIKDRGQSYCETIKGVKVYRVPKIEIFKYGKQSKVANLPEIRRIIVRLKGMIGYCFEYLYFTVACFFISLFVLLKDRFDVIHTHNPPDTLFVLPLFYKILGKKFIYDHHDLSPELFSEKYGSGKNATYNLLLCLEKISCKIADRIIATNESYKKIEMERCGVKAENIYVVRNGPDLNEMKISEPIQAIRSKAKTILCYLGAINIQDGVDYLLDVLSKIVYRCDHKDVCLLIIGDGDYLFKIRQLANETALNDHIIFTGFVADRQKLNEYLSSADIFVDAASYSLLNDNSTFVKHMEYMVFEKPVVSFALKESMFSLKNAGVFIPPNDTEKMAKAIIELIDDRQLRSKLGAIARRRVKQLSWDKVSIPLIQAYESLQ